MNQRRKDGESSPEARRAHGGPAYTSTNGAPINDAPINHAPLRILWRLLAERRGLFLGNLGLRLVKDLLPFVGPILVGMAVDLLSGASGRDRNLFGIELTQNDTRSILIVAAAMAVLAIAKAAFGYVHTIVAALMGRHVVQAARRDLAEAAMQMSLDERRRFATGDLLDRCLADSKGLRSFTQNVVIRIISNTVRAIFPVVFMFSIDWVLAALVLAVIPLQSSVSAILQRRLQRQTRDARQSEAHHTSAVKEAIDGWGSVASVGGQDWATGTIHSTARKSEDAKIAKKQTTASISAVISLCTALGIAAVYAIGGWRIIDSGILDGDTTTGTVMTLGTLTAFVGVAKKTYAPFRAYTKIVSTYRTGLVNLERIAEVLDAPMIDPREDGPDLTVSRGEISLRDVSFKYHDGETPTFTQLSGTLPGRSLTVITGPSGAGKTTLLRLLLGLDVPTTGQVLFDGQDINKARFASIQQEIALVPQEPVLFMGTMQENLLLGLENVSEDRLRDACLSAGLVDTIRGMPEGLETEVGSGRHMLSGGQLRRVAIARALLRDPALLLLDEPTTGLDTENSRLVLDTLRQISDRTTVVMVSHRSEPLRASDHHIVLADGAWSKSPMQLDTTYDATEHHATAGSGNGSTGANSETNGNGHHRGDHRHSAGDRNGSSDGRPSHNDTHATQTSGIQATPSNGAGRERRAPSGRAESRALGRTLAGSPITMHELDALNARVRLLAINGLRFDATPTPDVLAALVSMIETNRSGGVAVAYVDNINPDGATITDDHADLRTAEARLLRNAITDWQPSVVVDVGRTVVDGDHDAQIVVRFVPHEAANEPPARDRLLATQIRHELDRQHGLDATYAVKLVGCRPGSLGCERPEPVIELTSLRSDSRKNAEAMIGALVAIYRAAAKVVPAGEGRSGPIELSGTD